MHDERYFENGNSRSKTGVYIDGCLKEKFLIENWLSITEQNSLLISSETWFNQNLISCIFPRQIYSEALTNHSFLQDNSKRTFYVDVAGTSIIS